MNEQYNSCSRTGERKALGKLMCLMPLIVPIVRGLWLPSKESLNIIHTQKNMQIMLPYNTKKGTKGDTHLT